MGQDLNSPENKHNFAELIKDNQLCHLNLDTTTKAYQKCSSEMAPPLEFWQTPTFVVGEFVVTIGMTAMVLCLTHAMGACN